MMSSSPISFHRNTLYSDNSYTNNKMWSAYSFSNSAFSSASPSTSYLPPPPPPPSPNDSLLDITPRKSSFSMASSRSNSCAFPSWPNRDSLYSDSEESSSAYLSDEDLFPSTSSSTSSPFSAPSSSAFLDDDDLAYGLGPAAIGAPELTTEEQINMVNNDTEDQERRLRHIAKIHAQLRAQQAAEQQAALRRKKRRVVTDKKRRTSSNTSSSSSTSSRTSSKSSSTSG